MKKSILAMTLVAMTVTFSGIASANGNQTKSKRNYLQAYNLASSAIAKCYNEKNLVECDRLNQIKSTLMAWCSQNDKDACTVYNSVIKQEGEIQAIELIGN
jgi:hypothetical protein